MVAPVFCAIDTPDLDRALSLARAMATAGVHVKLGLEFFNAQGPDGVREVMEACSDQQLFLDLKYHDIPNTVAQAVRAAIRLRPSFLNVHASGGLDMMRAAQAACLEEADMIGVTPPRLLAVTVLTSFDDAGLAQTGQPDGAAAQVTRLAALAQAAGLAGVVCSSHETTALKSACGDDFILMVPGLRPVGSDQGDQKRVMTPAAAVQAGATHLVIGRPITAAADPVAATRAILASLEAA